MIWYVLIILAASACAAALWSSSADPSAPRRHAFIRCKDDGQCSIVDPGDLRLTQHIYADHCYGRWPRITKLDGKRLQLMER